jgi:hypothetical protein
MAKITKPFTLVIYILWSRLVSFSLLVTFILVLILIFASMSKTITGACTIKLFTAVIYGFLQ